jgi:Protein of unknown function (DUF2878)
MLRNIICFQLGWFTCVLGAAHHHPWLGVLVSIFLLVCHLLASGNWIREGRLILLTMLIGFLFDFVLMSLGWIWFEPLEFWSAQLPPPWMILLWALFATTLNFSLNWLKTKSPLAIILGAISGPLAYWAGSKLGALKLIELNGAMIYLGVGWAIVLPALLKIASSIDLYSDLHERRRS